MAGENFITQTFNLMKKLSFTILILAFSYTANAQPHPPNSDNPAPIPGLVLLGAAGAIVGIRRHNQKNK